MCSVVYSVCHVTTYSNNSFDISHGNTNFSFSRLNLAQERGSSWDDRIAGSRRRESEIQHQHPTNSTPPTTIEHSIGRTYGPPTATTTIITKILGIILGIILGVFGFEFGKNKDLVI